jgi:hypothetical protein
MLPALLPLLFASAVDAQEPPTTPIAAPQAPISATWLYQDFARKLHSAPVVHIRVTGELLTPDPADPAQTRFSGLDAEVWMLKGAKSRACVRWSTPGSQEGAPPNVSTQWIRSDGLNSYTWFEGETQYQRESLAEGVFVPYPLPEFFAVFDGSLEERLPLATESKDFVWSKELGNQPTVVLLDELRPDAEPATWVTFRRESGLFAGYCTLVPERVGGETLRVHVRTTDFPATPPRDLGPFTPPQGMTECPPPPAPEPPKKD